MVWKLSTFLQQMHWMAPLFLTTFWGSHLPVFLWLPQPLGAVLAAVGVAPQLRPTLSLSSHVQRAIARLLVGRFRKGFFLLNRRFKADISSVYADRAAATFSGRKTALNGGDQSRQVTSLLQALLLAVCLSPFVFSLSRNPTVHSLLSLFFTFYKMVAENWLLCSALHTVKSVFVTPMIKIIFNFTI